VAKRRHPRTSEQSSGLRASDVVLRALRDRFGNEAATSSGANRESAITDFISTQCLALNMALGRPGIPCGRLTVIQGKEASGKTTVVTHIMAECQRRGGLAVYIDAEYAFDTERAARMGLYDEDTLPTDSDLLPVIIVHPEHVEDALAKIDEIVTHVRAEDEDLLSVIVWDSIAGTPTKSEVEGSFEDMQPGIHARRLSAGLRKITREIAQHKIALVFVNQLKEVIGGFGFGGPQMTTIAARPLGFHCTVRVETTQVGVVGKDKRSSTGIICKAKLSKNKMAPPFREAEFIIDYATGIDDAASRMMLAQQMGLVTKKGGYLAFEGQTFRASTVPDDIRAAINERLEAYRASGGVSVPPGGDDDEEDE
jgi:recombination protein RecA